MSTHPSRGSVLARLTCAAVAAVLPVELSGCGSAPDDPPAAAGPADPPPSAPATPTATPTATTPRSEPMPDTVTGYRAMFDRVPVAQWGGGDIAITSPLSDGRIVWLFGDTYSERGMARSTGLVQSGSTLHVSRRGAQLLPDGPRRDGRATIYWPNKVAEVGDGVVAVWAAQISVGTDGPFDFRPVRPAHTRTALLRVTPAGDLLFLRWAGWTPRPRDPAAVPADGSDVRIIGPSHWGYQRITHIDLPLSRGRCLVTESQNWDNDLSEHVGPDGFRWHDYRPLLSAGPC